ncbi:MAG: flippase-like domain-containing protein [Clostridia bacterium]|nr:flippase-like domain-containing protein [Clostridia bacterium]
MEEKIQGCELQEQSSAVQTEQNRIKMTDGNDKTARYTNAKERDLERITKEIEEKRAAEKQAKNRKFWIKTALLLILIGASIALLFGVTDYFTEESTKHIGAMIWETNFGYFILLLCVVLLYMLFESAKYSYLLKISTGKWLFKNSMKTMFLGKYYDGITPLATGGQAFQIYYLHKKDIPAGVATAVPLVKFIVNTFAFGVLAVIFLSLAATYLPGNIADRVLLVWAWISMGLNMLIPVAIVLVSLFPRFGKKGAVWIVGTLAKLKIVKHKYRLMHKYVHEIDEYRLSLKAIIKRWWLILPHFVLCIVGAAIGFSVPFFVVVALADVTPTFELLVQILSLSIISYYSSSLIPTPGSSGAQEFTSSFVFSTVFVGASQIDPVVGWVILVWRFLTYYIYILSGIGINVFEIIRDAVRNRRAE